MHRADFCESVQLLQAILDMDNEAKRKIRNRTNIAIQCRVYDVDNCDTLKDKPIFQANLRPGHSISMPASVLGKGVLVLQPARMKVDEQKKMMSWQIGRWSRPTDLGLAPRSGFVFEFLDADGDGHITRAEYNAGFDMLDTNKDGFISREEFGCVSSIPFHLLDKDGNEKISRKEWEDGFDCLDANGDGYITKAEFNAVSPQIPVLESEMLLSLGSKESGLRNSVLQNDQKHNYYCVLAMAVDVPMVQEKVNAILTDITKKKLENFKLQFAEAVRIGMKNVESVCVRYIQCAGPGLLSIDFVISLSNDKYMGGLLFDIAADLSQRTLSQKLVSSGLLDPEKEVVMVKEATFERSADCSSPQLPKTCLHISSNDKLVDISAPWRLCNVLPKPAVFNIFGDSTGAALGTVALEPGQEMMQFFGLTYDASIWIIVEFDGYQSKRQQIFRRTERIECELHRKNGAELCCSLEITRSGHTGDFLVVFCMNVIVINRTGLSLSFGRCRPVGEAIEVQAASAFPDPQNTGKTCSKVDNVWIIKRDKEHEQNSWNMNDPDIVMLHMPEGGWRPCLRLQGTNTWKQLRGDKDDGLMSTLRILGPGPAGGPPLSNGTEAFSYNLGVSMAQGLPPFQRSLYITVTPKYTVLNKTGLTMQVRPGKIYENRANIFGQISDMCTMATIGIFQAAPVDARDSSKKNIFDFMATSEQQVEEKRSLRIRLLGQDGQPTTEFSQPFGVDNQNSVALRLLHPSKTLKESVDNSVHVHVHTRMYGAATFVEITSTEDIQPMFTITNDSKYVVKVWQPESHLVPPELEKQLKKAYEEACDKGEKLMIECGAIDVQPEETVPLFFDNPETSNVSFLLEGCKGVKPVTINLKRPSQVGYICVCDKCLRQNKWTTWKEVHKLKNIKYMTTISGYTRGLKISVVDKQFEYDAEETLVVKTRLDMVGIGFSLVAHNREEVMYASILGVEISNTLSLACSEINFNVRKIQIDNQTLSGSEVAMLAGSEQSFLDCTIKKNIQVTAMPYFELVDLEIAPFCIQMHETWLQRILKFEEDALSHDLYDQQEGTTDVSSKVKYRVRGLLGWTSEKEQELKALSFLGKDIKIRLQFFENMHLRGVAGQATVHGLSCISLRPEIDARVGPVSNIYNIMHRMGQKMPIPDLNETDMNLPELNQENLMVEMYETGSVGLTGVILNHYRDAIIKVGLKVLASGAAWGEILATVRFCSLSCVGVCVCVCQCVSFCESVCLSLLFA